MPLFGTSGIRRKFDRALLEIALNAGVALGTTHKEVIVGRDTRTSGNALKQALVSGLLSAGAHCYDAGVVTTPTLALAARGFRAGVMITASHNPSEYNGIKVFNPDGSSFDSAQQADLESAILNKSLATAAWSQVATTCLTYEKAIEEHIERILEIVKPKPGVKVVLDCDSGAGSVISPFLLRRMGCNVVTLNCHPSGFFPHEIEPLERNLSDLIKITGELGGIGIAHDGDADRMMAVDDKGRFIPGDKLLVLLARQAGAKEIVTTVDASMIVDEAGFHVNRTKVGDSFVSDDLRKGGDFGGEPSGAWIFPRISFCPDGIYAAAALVEIAGRERLSELVDDIPEYPVLRGSVASDGTAMPELKKVLASLRPASIDDRDGIKLVFPDGWLLVRPSGTEPKIRITAEARNEPRVRELYDNAVKAISHG